MAAQATSNGNGASHPSWMRRVVPAGYAQATLQLIGTSPLLMKNGETDKDSALYRSFYALGQKRGKSLDDNARLREMEWQLGLYLDGDIGPYIPGKNVKEMLRQSATKWKKGEEIKRSLIVVENRIPLVYDGPRDQDGLWEAGFRYTTLASNGGVSRGRVDRCRPSFSDWSLTAALAFDPEDLDFDLLQLVVERSQKYGLGDYRPQFGSFRATLTLDGMFKDEARGDATDKKDSVASDAHRAFVDRIKVGA